MNNPQETAYVVRAEDNVATTVTGISCGRAQLIGARAAEAIEVTQPIAHGHKVALKPIAAGEAIVKYGMCIGTATRDIAPGTHVHLHNMRSNYDERAATLDVATALSTDVEYTLY